MDEQKTVEEEAAALVASDIVTMAKTITGLSGTPYGVTTLSPRNELWAWGYEDETVDVDGLRMAGLPDAEIAAKRFPLQRHLMEQAGVAYPEQEAYANRVTARWIRARDEGKLPSPMNRKTLGPPSNRKPAVPGGGMP